MLFFVAFIGIANLALGYALAVYVRMSGRPSLRDFFRELLNASPSTLSAAPIVATGEPHAARAESIADASQLPTTVNAVSADATLQRKSDGDMDPATGFAPREAVKQLLVDLAEAAAANLEPASVALLEMDTAEEISSLAGDRLLGGVANTVRELLAESHLAARYDGQKFLLLMPGDDEAQATQLTEQVRQRIEATEFVANGQGVHATVSCALMQLATESTVAELLASLQETLDEAKQLGGNRTYLFDGLAPAPVVPPELNFAPKRFVI